MQNYLNMLEEIMSIGDDRGDRTGTGTRSLFGYQIKFNNIWDAFPLVTTKKVDLKNIFVELKWMLSGSTNIKYMVDEGCNIWVDWPHKYYNQMHGILRTVPPISATGSQIATRKEFIEAIKNDPNFAKEWGECGPVYGFQWRKWPHFTAPRADPGYEIPLNCPIRGVMIYKKEFDQFKYVFDCLRNRPEDRRMIVNAWNAPYVEEMGVKGLPPCHVMFQFYTRKLTLTQRIEWMKDNLMGADFEGLTPQTEDGLDQCGIPARYIDCHMYIRSGHERLH